MPKTVPPARDYTGARKAATQHMLTEMIVGARTPAAHRRRTVAWLTGMAIAGGAVAGAAVATNAFAPAADRSLARCHSTADLGRGDNFAGTSVAAADANGIVTIDHAVQSCADLWRQGILTEGADQIGEPSPGGGARIPPLVGCVDSDGFAAVFPGDDGLCARLGLASLVEVR